MADAFSEAAILRAESADASAATLALKLGYKGAAYSGFARQEGQTTVQGELERALGILFRRDVETVCAGRTDVSGGRDGRRKNRGVQGPARAYPFKPPTEQI